jgi:hypothetical protein
MAKVLQLLCLLLVASLFIAEIAAKPAILGAKGKTGFDELDDRAAPQVEWREMFAKKSATVSEKEANLEKRLIIQTSD